MITAIDVDGTIRNFAQSLIDVYRKDHPGHKVTPVEEWNEYPLEKYFPIGKKIYKYTFEERAREIYLCAKPYKGAYSFMRRLHENNGVVIVSFQPNKVVERFTTQWLDGQDIERDATVYIKRKQDVGVDVLLDDYTENLESVVGSSVVPVCIDRPWNQDWKGLRVYDYEDFLQLVKGGKDGICDKRFRSKTRI